MKANAPYYIYRIANCLHKWHIPIIPFVFQQLLRFIFCCFIPYQTKIGKNAHFSHLGMGVVLHKACVIGNNAIIDQQVTIGGRTDDKLPVIGDNVRIGAGAKVLGGVHIGNNAKVGANAVVLIDVPDGATAVGVPARIVQK